MRRAMNASVKIPIMAVATANGFFEMRGRADFVRDLIGQVKSAENAKSNRERTYVDNRFVLICDLGLPEGNSWPTNGVQECDVR